MAMIIMSRGSATECTGKFPGLGFTGSGFGCSVIDAGVSGMVLKLMRHRALQCADFSGVEGSPKYTTSPRSTIAHVCREVPTLKNTKHYFPTLVAYSHIQTHETRLFDFFGRERERERDHHVRGRLRSPTSRLSPAP